MENLEIVVSIIAVLAVIFSPLFFFFCYLPVHMCIDNKLSERKSWKQWQKKQTRI